MIYKKAHSKFQYIMMFSRYEYLPPEICWIVFTLFWFISFEPCFLIALFVFGLLDKYWWQIPVKAPGRARGELEITYLDEELRLDCESTYINLAFSLLKFAILYLDLMQNKVAATQLFLNVTRGCIIIFFCCGRVSRGDKGNLFILTMVDPSYRVPTWSMKNIFPINHNTS